MLTSGRSPAPVWLDPFDEFERQVETLLNKGYPQAAQMSRSAFLRLVEPLRQRLSDAAEPILDYEYGLLPFVIVVKGSVVPAETAMTLADLRGRSGVAKLFPRQSSDFSPMESVTIPDAPVYLLTGIDRGKATLNQPPSAAMIAITAAGRSPLTIDEGVALITQHPEFLRKNNCFTLPASRCAGDQRVPAIWINRLKQPNLGWCWNGNPHTWLGSASCEQRLG